MNHAQPNHPAVTLSIRVQPKIMEQLEELSGATCRTKSFLAAEAIECYLAVQAWQTKAVEKSLSKANSKKANFISHDKVADWLKSWGTQEELESPK
jgi:RHH-type transcriptional regulator, rel operon repressor / antitoxin RelB